MIQLSQGYWAIIYIYIWQPTRGLENDGRGGASPFFEIETRVPWFGEKTVQIVSIYKFSFWLKMLF